MATWEDGPEYAPHERPQYFADAPLPPLEKAPPFLQPAANAPAARPRFDDPPEPVAPLATLVPVPADQRDPNRPFDVVSSNLTGEPSWAGIGRAVEAPPDAPVTALTPHTAATPFPSAPSQAQGQPVPPPSAPNHPWPVLDQAPGAPQPDPYAYPAPGTPGWFAPPPTPYGEQRPNGKIGAKEVVEAATPGLCICLAIGGLIYVLAPVMIVVAVFLSTRVAVAQRAVRIAFRVAAGAVAFFAVVGLARAALSGAPWWSFLGYWSLTICWVMLVVLGVTVYRALARPTAPQQPPQQPPWR